MVEDTATEFAPLHIATDSIVTRLPTEVIARIATCLKVEDGKALARVKKTWQQAAERVLWRDVVRKDVRRTSVSLVGRILIESSRVYA